MTTTTRVRSAIDWTSRGTAFSKLALVSGPFLLTLSYALDLLDYDVWSGLLAGLGLFFVLLALFSFGCIALLSTLSR